MNPSIPLSMPMLGANCGAGCACIRYGHSTRLPRLPSTDRRGQIPDMVCIHVRPPEVEDRVMLGH
jgi:IS30 family transposase